MQLASLGSGSKGNATLIRAGETLVLVDNGFSPKELVRRAEHLGIDLSTLSAILVTHEHSDHCAGVAALARRFSLPVYATHGTFASGRMEGAFERHPFDADSDLKIGDLSVHAVAVPHDAREPVQYVFRHAEQTVGILTDLGMATSHVQSAFSACDALLLEFNHDRRMLAEGPYPPALKRRVGGDWGHLANTQAVALLACIDHERLQHLAIAHISEKNNCRDAVESAIRQDFAHLLDRVVWASQGTGFPWLKVTDRSSYAAARPASALETRAGAEAY
ncbi:MAG: MBL fold metallo-hydrolase [Pseudomonadota bacterium]